MRNRRRPTILTACFAALVLHVSVLTPLSVVAQARSTAPTRTSARNAQEARRHCESGSRAFHESRFEAALRYFEQAYQIAPRAELLYDVGRAAEETQATPLAIEAYRQYLSETTAATAVDGSADSRHAEVEGRLAVLEAPATRTVVGPATIDGPREPSADQRMATVTTYDTNSENDSHSATDEGWFWPVVLGGATLVAGGVVLTVVLTCSSNGVATGDDGVRAQAPTSATIDRSFLGFRF